MFALLTSSLPAPTASVTSAATSTGLGFGTTVVLGIALAVVAVIAFVQIAHAVLPRLIQGLIVVGSVVLVAGVVGSVVVLIRSLYQVVAPR